MAKNTPMFRVEMRGLVSVTAWQNENTDKKGNKFKAETVQLCRRYKDSNGDWQTTTSMRLDDIPKAISALRKAYENLTIMDLEKIAEPSQETDEYAEVAEEL